MAITCETGEHLGNPIGTVHGGVAASLLDSTAGSAVHTTLPAGTAYSSFDLTTDPRLRARLVRVQQELTGQPSHVDPSSPLSPREIDVLRLVEVGATNLEIAARLGLSLETVKAYLRSALRKLGVRNRTAAAHQARLNGLL